MCCKSTLTVEALLMETSDLSSYWVQQITMSSLKPMDSFGTCGENQMKLFFYIQS